MKSQTKISILTLTYPIGGKYQILSESDFVRLYINSPHTLKEISKKYNISIHVLNTSMKYYRSKYSDSLILKNSQNLSRSAFQRVDKNDPRPEQEKIIPKEELVSLISEGNSELKIAEILGLSPQTVRKNIKRYKLPIPTGKVRNLTDEEWVNLEWADRLVPGVLESSFRAIDNPSEYFHLLYDAFVAVSRVLWTIQKLARRYDLYRQGKKVPRDHVSWSSNKQEIILSERLRSENIPHVRNFLWARDIGRAFAADIFIPEFNLLVEIDGSVHTISTVADRDEEKRPIARSLGYKILAFSAKEVEKDLERVISTIKEEMKNG